MPETTYIPLDGSASRGSCFGNLSALEKILILLSAALAIFVLGLTIALVNCNNSHSDNGNVTTIAPEPTSDKPSPTTIIPTSPTTIPTSTTESTTVPTTESTTTTTTEHSTSTTNDDSSPKSTVSAGPVNFSTSETISPTSEVAVSREADKATDAISLDGGTTK